MIQRLVFLIVLLVIYGLAKFGGSAWGVPLAQYLANVVLVVGGFCALFSLAAAGTSR